MCECKTGSLKRALLITPLVVYFLSYCYLAIYHGYWNLVPVIVHEGGTLTWLQTTLFASHFLGHIPVHLVLSLWLVGCCLSTGKTAPAYFISKKILTFTLFIFLGISLALALQLNGWEDTKMYLSQWRQNHSLDTKGGSWLLHLPSTITLFFLIPLIVFATRYCTFLWILCMLSKKSTTFISCRLVYHNEFNLLS